MIVGMGGWINNVVLCVDDKDQLCGVVAADKRVVSTMMLNQHGQPPKAKKSGWRSNARR